VRFIQSSLLLAIKKLGALAIARAFPAYMSEIGSAEQNRYVPPSELKAQLQGEEL
jgi:hypothetical protein